MRTGGKKDVSYHKTRTRHTGHDGAQVAGSRCRPNKAERERRTMYVVVVKGQERAGCEWLGICPYPLIMGG